jgi:hypothetical protein
VREFSKVAAAIWSSKRFRALTDNARLLLVYYLTSPHQNSAGCFALPDLYASCDINWPLERYLAARADLIGAGLVQFDEASGEILIVGWFRHCAPQNPSHRKSVILAIERISSEKLRTEARAQLTASDTAEAERNLARAGSTKAVSLLDTSRIIRNAQR